MHPLALAGGDADLEGDLTGLGELDGVVDEVGQDLGQTQGVADQVVGHPGGDMDEEFQALLVGLEANHGGDVAEDVVEPEGDVLHLQLVGLDLGKVEDVVDDAKQGVAGPLDLLQVVALLGGQFGLEGQVGHADDGVHRRADLVAHVGQEQALGLGCRLGLQPRLLHLGGLGADGGVGLEQFVLLQQQLLPLFLQFLLGGAQFLGLGAKDGRLALGLVQQFPGALVALEDLQAQRQGLDQVVQQFPAAVIEGGEGRQLHHRQQATVGGQYRDSQEGTRQGLAQARADADIVRRDVADLDRLFLAGALTDQPLTEVEGRGQALTLAVAVTTHQDQFPGLRVEVEEDAHLGAGHRRQPGHQHPGEVLQALLALDGSGDVRQLGLHPGGAGLGLGGQLQGPEGGGHGADLITAVTVGELGVQLAGGDPPRGDGDGLDGPEDGLTQVKGQAHQQQQGQGLANQDPIPGLAVQGLGLPGGLVGAAEVELQQLVHGPLGRHIVLLRVLQHQGTGLLLLALARQGEHRWQFLP